jgi:phosphatidylserine decarboxylase
MSGRALYEARWILAVLGGLWLVMLPFVPYVSVPLAAALLAVLCFFRDPVRCAPGDASLAVAPADGRVVAVEDCDGDGLLGGPVRRVVIFLSIFDVHVNRSPIAGTVEHSEPASGSFLDARNPLSSERNARRTWVIRGPQCAVVVRQITGAIARRIVAWNQVGDCLERGQRIGMIRFGSRTEVDFPEGVELLVGVGDRVRGGETPVAKIPPQG